MSYDKRIGNRRADGVKFPDNMPRGWWHMKIALCEFGTLLLPKGCSYNFVELALHGALESDTNPAAAELSFQAADYASRNLPWLAREFSGACQEGTIVTGYSALGGGKVEIMDPNWWFTTDPLLRYRSFSIDPSDPFSERVDLPCWIWVEEQSMMAEVERLRRKKYGYGPPPAPFDDSKFFRAIIIEEGTKAGRPDKYTRIFEIFRARIEADAVASRCAWEGKAIHEAWGSDGAATPKVCADHIRRIFNLIQRDAKGSIVNRDHLLDEIDSECF